MYSFDGTFKQKPKQSLGGASKKEQKHILLQRTQEERRKREEYRRKVSSSCQIQAFYRGSKTREYQRSRARQIFDHHQAEVKSQPKEPLNQEVLSQLLRHLNFCFRHSEDENRLVWLCQLLVREKDVCVRHITNSNTNGFHQIKTFLHICCRYLECIANTQNPLSAPLRVLEVYLDNATYNTVADEDVSIKIIRNIFQFLIGKGYYQSMKVLVENKVPGSIERTTTPPTPMADTIFSMITKPLTLAPGNVDPKFRNLAFQSLCKQFFCTPYPEQVSQFLLPAMAYGRFPFPLLDLLHALLPDQVEMAEERMGITHLTVEATPWLLCALLMISENRLADLNRNAVQLYLLVLQYLVPQLHQGREPVDTGQDSDSEDELEAMQVDSQMNTFSTLPEVRAECLRLLNQPDHVKGVVSVTTQNTDPSVLLAVCTVCHTLISQTKLSVHHARFLYSLAFNPVFLKRVWNACITTSTTSVTGAPIPLLQMISRGLELAQHDVDRIIPFLSMFCCLFSHSLMSLHDAEFYGDNAGKSTTMPFTLSELAPMALVLRDACLGVIRICHPETSHHISEGYRTALKSVGVPLQDRAVTIDQVKRQKSAWFHLFKVMSHLVKQLYARDGRRQFCPKGHWLAEHIDVHLDKPYKLFEAQNAVGAWTFGAFSILQPTPQVLEDIMVPSVKEARQLTVLMELPFVIPFQERVKIFQKLIEQDKGENQGELHHFGRGPMIQLTVRRNYLYEDAFEKLSPENEPNLKLKVQVQLMNFAGLNEAGIDGGGVFREFLSELLKTSFDPNRGFFKYTSDQLLYPNPQAQVLFENMTSHYYFIGRMLGKALYENMLVELPFASFFLSKILSRHGGDVDIHHLASLDPEVYKNLLFLKHYDGDVADLGLDFTVTSERLGEVQVEELKPGGKDITVTNNNRIEYIHLVAHHKLNKQIRSQCSAFRQGLADVINLEWLRMFDHQELQVLISGAQIPIDLDDLRSHTTYSGGYSADHKVITYFWKAVAQFSDRQKRQLLKFVTSCSRPPLLGFRDLFPAFCIHYGGDDAERLPTASTCMNLLKLPAFSSEASLKEKLLYAVESNAGFELS